MRSPLDMAGKGLAGAGLTGVVLYVVGTATQRSWPVWPYGVFGIMLVVGGALFVISQRSTVPSRTADRSRHADYSTAAEPLPVQPSVPGRASFPAEVIMLRARSLALADALGAAPFKNAQTWSGLHVPAGPESQYTSANRALAQSLAGDIARVQQLAGHNRIGRRLAHARKIADRLVSVLREGAKSHPHEWVASPVSADLLYCLLDIPIDTSGCDMSGLTLPRLEALNGVIWSDDTTWPTEEAAAILQHSQPVRSGVYQIVFDSLE